MHRTQTEQFKQNVNKYTTHENFYKTFWKIGRRDVKNKSMELKSNCNGNKQLIILIDNYAQLAAARRMKLHKKSKLAQLINPSKSSFEIDHGSHINFSLKYLVCI